MLSQIQAPILSKGGGRTTTKKDWNLEPSNKATFPQIQALIVKRLLKNSTTTREFGMFKTRRHYHKSKPQFLAKGASRTTTKKDWNLEPSNKATFPQIQALIVKRLLKNSTTTREFGMFKTRRHYHKSKPQFLAKGAIRTTTKKY